MGLRVRAAFRRLHQRRWSPYESVGEIVCSVDNEHQDLLPDANVLVNLLIEQHSSTLVVPRTAVFRDKGKYFVYSFEEGKLRRREIILESKVPLNTRWFQGLEQGKR